MVIIVTNHGTFTGYCYELYENRVILFSVVDEDELQHLRILPFMFREVISLDML